MPESFLTYWIKKGMQSEEEREAETRERMEKSMKGSVKLRQWWDKPLLDPGYWNSSRVISQTRERHAETKGTPVSIYQQALDDVEAGRETARANK